MVWEELGVGPVSAREEILKAARDALRRSGRSGRGRIQEIPRNYSQSGELPGSSAVVAELEENLRGYGAHVRHAKGQPELLDAISAELEGLDSVVIPVDAPVDWIRTAMARHLVYLDSREEPLPHAVLDKVSAVLTASRCAVASTGTIVLDGVGGQGRRAVSLIPDTHIAVVDTDSVVETVPEAFAVLAKHPTRPLTWIAGPSATSDIELSRVEGVHGPRHLKVILYTAKDAK